MCQRGDIILIDHYISQESRVGRHPFIVLDDKNGEIKGVTFDFIGLAMSSFKDADQKERKLKYPGNFPIAVDDFTRNDKAPVDGYVKAEQFYYFDKSKINFKVIGKMDEDIFNLLLEYIQELAKQGVEFEQITDNLT